MAAWIRLLFVINSFIFVLSEYCHIEDRTCGSQKRRVIQKLEVKDPEHCQQECDKHKGKGCRSVEYFKGVCTVVRGMCKRDKLKRSPDTQYFYKPWKGKCPSNDTAGSRHVNLARDRLANQTSLATDVIPLGPAKYAVDGNNEPDFTKRSCTQTRAEKSPHWFVDLGKNYTVTSVSITNRKDALAAQFHDFTVSVLREPPGNDYRPKLEDICIYRNMTFTGEQGFVCDKPRKGRFVVVHLMAQAGIARTLSLCEVEVFSGIAPQGFIDGDAFDLARGRPAYQIVTGGYPMKPAYLATDGNPDRNLTRGHCSATDWIPNPWWAVDLQAEYWVKGVRLVNRADCCADRLSHLLIAVTTTPPRIGDAYRPTMDEECALRPQVVYGAAYLECQEPIWGRYVVVIVGTSYLQDRQLSLCEVNVFAQY